MSIILFLAALIVTKYKCICPIKVKTIFLLWPDPSRAYAQFHSLCFKNNLDWLRGGCVFIHHCWQDYHPWSSNQETSTTLMSSLFITAASDRPQILSVQLQQCPSIPLPLDLNYPISYQVFLPFSLSLWPKL